MAHRPRIIIEGFQVKELAEMIAAMVGGEHVVRGCKISISKNPAGFTIHAIG
jgi:hypothetical protein